MLWLDADSTRWSNGIWDPMELMQIVEPIVRRFSKLLYSRRGSLLSQQPEDFKHHQGFDYTSTSSPRIK